MVFLHGVGGSHLIFYKQARLFKKNMNCLFINFPGHGKSKSLDGDYSYTAIVHKVIEVLDHLQISKCHLIGISLGTIIMNEFSRVAPERISSMILGGAVISWKPWTDFLFKLAYTIRHLVPYMLLYRIFAGILMPRRNHKYSREFFITAATKVGQPEFIKWADLLINAQTVFTKALDQANDIPKLYIMGAEDHVFLDGAKFAVSMESNSRLETIPQSGHVCNIDQAEAFNRLSLAFINQQAQINSNKTTA
ncbi:Pimeloyl-ACP methyl ester carboxylesterase [Litchfieldia salsa]|uniref:Pimeloyl-ACP methyl ester carboxylesterase n=1 Tax=Litchfieldia salsa TaxID=930152 RepID=A0A1H0W3G1_9BACI|nr:Pimeloyl-ACP methyl ester carboxylesterase [Litchfieldia salsa]